MQIKRIISVITFYICILFSSNVLAQNIVCNSTEIQNEVVVSEDESGSISVSVTISNTNSKRAILEADGFHRKKVKKHPGEETVVSDSKEENNRFPDNVLIYSENLQNQLKKLLNQPIFLWLLAVIVTAIINNLVRVWFDSHRLKSTN